MWTVLALAGWPDVRLPAGAWSGHDVDGRPLALAHVARDTAESAPAVASNEARSVAVVLAGRLYNYRELRTSLGGRHAFDGRSDAQVVAHLYAERGVQCVKALRGAFALALWDGRLRRLLLARDQLGLVPLYYAAERGRLAAASSLATLVALPGLASAWDAAALDAFLTFGSVPPPATLYPAIRQLGPGELVLWEDGPLRGQRYWQLSFPERRLARPDLADLVRVQTLEALRLRQTGSVSALLLSGGLDAAGLLALAAVNHRPPARAYTAAPAGLDHEEVQTAARLAEQVHLEHVVFGEPLDWSTTVDTLLAAHGAPAGGPDSAIVHMAAVRAAADVQVGLAGVGGEEVFGGSAPARVAEQVRRFRQLPGLAREGAEVWVRLIPSGWGESLRRLVHDERLAPLEMYARTISLFLPEERAELYTPEWFAALADVRPWEPLTGLFADAVGAGAADAADAIHYAELTLRLPARAAVALAMPPGFELRLPLADHRLAQLAASVPPALRGNAKEGQLLLRAALEKLLPPSVLRRPHVTPAPPPHTWTEGSLRTLLDETLAPARVTAQGIFRPETVRRLCREHLVGQRDHGMRLWAIMLVTRWLERQSALVTPGVRAVG